jgi:hypothetical protein
VVRNRKGNKKSAGPAVQHAELRAGRLGGAVVQVAAVLAIAGALNFGYWYRLDREKKSIESQTRLAEQKNRELSDIKVRFWNGRSKPMLISGGWM